MAVPGIVNDMLNIFVSNLLVTMCLNIWYEQFLSVYLYSKTNNMKQDQTTVSIEQYRSFTMEQIREARAKLDIMETALQSNDKAMIIRISNVLTKFNRE